VTALCTDHGQDGSTTPAPAKANFTLVATARAEKPTLTLDTPTGPRSSPVTASGSGFACGTGGVQLLWDGESPPLAEAQSGKFTVTLTVPSTASVGGHTVVASCPNNRDITVVQSFTVTSSAVSGGTSAVASGETSAVASGETSAVTTPTTPAVVETTPPHSGFVGWVIALIIGVALLVVLAYLLSRGSRARRPPRHVATRVQAVSRPGGPPVVTLRETPAPGEATHALRVQAHSDPGTLTIREVDDDHGHPE
jgi:hypothetical protein